MAIGSVNRAEFFVTLVQSATFVAVIGIGNWPVVAGLCIGGGAAASLAAKMARRIKAELPMIAVGIVIVLLSLRTLVMTFFS
jgi:uncharacterized membrane protein YfcA